MMEKILLCTVHNIEFGGSRLPEPFVYRCPICVQKELESLRRESGLLLKHRDILVAAIEVKQSIEISRK